MGGFVALLRGVNVGGKNRVPMAALARLFVAAGCKSVRTFIQSGNVVFDARPAVIARLPGVLDRSFAKTFGFPTSIVMRSARDLAAIVAANPFKGHEDSLHVFLADRPKAAAIAALDPTRSPGDEFAVVGREIFLHCPNRLGRTKLSNDYFDRKLATTGTVRNWRTVTKLLELTRGRATVATGARSRRARPRDSSSARSYWFSPPQRQRPRESRGRRVHWAAIARPCRRRIHRPGMQPSAGGRSRAGGCIRGRGRPSSTELR